jgi:hypothetical protein
MMGGRYGRWDPRDHDLFLKILTQSGIHLDFSDAQLQQKNIINSTAKDGEDEAGNIFSEDERLAVKETDLFVFISKSQKKHLLAKLVNSVPLKNIEEIEEHINWYILNSYYNDVKKIILTNWRDTKITNLAIKQDGNEIPPPSDLPPDTLQVNEEERAAMKERIAEWKAKRLEEQKQQMVELSISKICSIEINLTQEKDKEFKDAKRNIELEKVNSPNSIFPISHVLHDFLT